MPIIKLELSIGYPGAVRKDEEFIDDEEWNAMTEEDRQDLLDEISTDWANSYIEISAKIKE